MWQAIYHEFRRWAKVSRAAAAPYNRTEITVETDQVLIIRRQWKRVWCPQCGCEVDAASLPEAENLPGISKVFLCGNAPSEAWHVCTGEDGEQFVCLQSLLKTG